MDKANDNQTPAPILFACEPENIIPGSPPEPAPNLLTKAQAIRYLRIDVDKPKKPDETLTRYVKEFGLRTVRFGRSYLYPLDELKRLIAEKIAHDNP